MFYNNINPVLFRIGPFEVRYYGLIYLIGFIVAFFIINHLAKRKELKLSKDDVWDLIFYIVVGAVIGARAFEVLIYNLSFYLSHPFEIIAVWHGGLSFHGGLIGALISGWLFCRKKKMDFYTLADISVMPLAFGLFLGRIGNFLNGELVGRITDVPWCVKFRDYAGCRHPSQLYESAKNLLIFFVLWSIKDKKLKKGTMFWGFILMYSFLRFFIEFFREPDLQLGFILGLTMGQWLNIAMFIVGAVFMWKVNRSNP